MAISVTTLAPADYGFAVNATSADASGCETLLAGVAGKSIILERIFINSTAQISITIGQEDAGASPTVDILGPIDMTVTSSVSFEFGRGIRLTTAKALVVDASGAGAINIIAMGRVE